MALLAKQDYDHVTLLASGTRTAVRANGDAVRLAGMVNAIALELDVTATGVDGTDTLDVYVQSMADGANYVDVYHFTQVIGTDTTKRYFGKVVANAALTEFENGAALGAAAGRAILGDIWRVRYTVVNAGIGGAATFTFSVHACPM